ncbi:MAG: hypothetical protein QOJ06_2960 [Pseudonocardiales bacterium]|jgi:hypothetical protein|nr:hypothetical protein [Pseudonocardiales bacterium]
MNGDAGALAYNHSVKTSTVRPHLHVHTFADRFTAQRAQAAGLSRSPRSGATSGEGRG